MLSVAAGRADQSALGNWGPVAGLGTAAGATINGASAPPFMARSANAGSRPGAPGTDPRQSIEDRPSQMLGSVPVGREVNTIALSLDSSRLICGLQDHTLQHWDVAARSLLTVLKGHKYWVNCVAYSPDSIRVASASADKTVKVWNVLDAVCESTLHGHMLSVASVAFSDDATRLASGSWDKSVRVWDVELGQLLLSLGGHTDWVHSVAWMPGSQHLASSSSDHSVRVWDVIAGVVEQVLVGHLQTVTSIHYARDGIHLASGSLDRTVRVWNIREGSLAARLQQDGDEGSVHSVQFAPDSERIVVGSKDKCVRIWNFRTGEQEGRLLGHEDAVLGVCITMDGSQIISCSHDKSLRFWRMASRRNPALPAPPCAPAGAALTAANQAALARASAAAQYQGNSSQPAPIVATYTVASSFKDLQERLRTTEDTNQRLRRQLSDAQMELNDKNRLVAGRDGALSDQDKQLTNYRDMINNLAAEKEKLERSFEEMRRELLQMPAAPAGVGGSAASGSQMSGGFPFGPAGSSSNGAVGAALMSTALLGRSGSGQPSALRVHKPAGGSEVPAQTNYGSSGRSNTPPQRLPARIAAGLRREQAGNHISRRPLPRAGAGSGGGFPGGGVNGASAPGSNAPASPMVGARTFPSSSSAMPPYSAAYGGGPVASYQLGGGQAPPGPGSSWQPPYQLPGGVAGYPIVYGEVPGPAPAAGPGQPFGRSM